MRYLAKYFLPHNCGFLTPYERARTWNLNFSALKFDCSGFENECEANVRVSGNLNL